MPVAANPLKRDFFVYTFRVDGYPFYVGIGRSRRASDRERYVGSLRVSRNAAKLKRSSFSVRVMAELLRRNKKMFHSRTRAPLTRPQALQREIKELRRLLAKGYFLTNWQHNPDRHRDAKKAVRRILYKRMRPAAKRHLVRRA